MARIYVTRRIPEEALELLRQSGEVRMWEEEDIPVPREVLEQECREADALYCLLSDRIDEALFELAPHLKVVSNMAVGYNNIDIAAAAQRGIVVTNTPGVLTETTADLTFALMMATARRLVEASDYLRQGQWKSWSPMQLTGQDLYGARLGIIGMGRIGEAVARRAKGFSMDVVYHNRSRKPEAEEQIGLQYVQMDELLASSDFVCLMAPYTPETHHLIGEAQLRLMKPSAILINTARGGMVDETALYAALNEGRLWAAGLDVFEQEPVALDHPLLQLPNVVTLPHIGSASIATRQRMAVIVAQNIRAVLAGEAPAHPVQA